MAKVTIIIEDSPDKSVRCVMEPNVAQMIDFKASGAGLTPAQAYALCAVGAIREESKKAEMGHTRIILPKGARGNGRNRNN